MAKNVLGTVPPFSLNPTDNAVAEAQCTREGCAPAIFLETSPTRVSREGGVANSTLRYSLRLKPTATTTMATTTTATTTAAAAAW
jgi:hypothetical protein